MKINPLWLQRKTSPGKETNDADLAHRIDLGRLTNSSALRRLQGKTQVMSVGEHDFFRTRLTHSMEVGNVGISVARKLKSYFEFKKETALLELIPCDALIQTICLAHDLGHPAFGHVGEKILNYQMRNSGGFEGNGQTLRLLSKLGEYYKDTGYNLSRRALLGVIKYPVLYSNALEAKWYAKNSESAVDDIRASYLSINETTPKNLDFWKPPKCLHDDEKDVFDWIMEPLSEEDKAKFTEIGKNGKTLYKSFDCSIMELADDISYAFHDMEDVVAMNLVNRHEVIADLKDILVYMGNVHTKDANPDFYIDLLKSDSIRDLKRTVSQLINHVIYRGVVYDEQEFDEPLLSYKAKLKSEYEEIVEKFKLITFSKVIQTPNLQTLEYKGLQILDQLFVAFKENYESLLPDYLVSDIKFNKVSRERAVCDFLASMTDKEAGSMYERMFTPSAGSVFQPIN